MHVMSWGRGAGQAYVSTSREEISPKGPLAAELGACARQDRWESIHNLISKNLLFDRATREGATFGSGLAPFVRHWALGFKFLLLSLISWL